MQLSALAPSAAQAPVAFGHAPTRRNQARETEHLETARRYLAAIEGGASGETLATFFAPDVEQVEFPNRLVPSGATRDLAAMLDGALRGQQVLKQQRFEIRRVHALGDVVVLELLWVGTLALTLGKLAPGEDMRAHFCVVLEYREGRIWRQRNYDCFEAF
jgi:ketosteroid isomerase-like protein